MDLTELLIGYISEEKETITMKFRKAQPEVEEEVIPDDPTSWLIDSSFAEFVLLNTYYIKIMVMLGYTFMHGTLR